MQSRARRPRVEPGRPPAVLRRAVEPAAIALWCCLSGCALFDRDNRRTTSWLDENATPASDGARLALAPLALPAGVVALAADAAIVHPISVVDDAWGDTVELLWSPRDESAFRRVVLTPLAAIATPLVFTGDWLGRSLLPLRPRRAPGEPAAPEAR